MGDEASPLRIPLAWSRDVAEEAYRFVVDELLAWLQRRLPNPPPDLPDRVFVAFAAVRGPVLLSLLYPAIAPPDERMIAHMVRGVRAVLVGELDVDQGARAGRLASGHGAP